MASIADFERDFIAQLESMGVATARSNMERGEFSPNVVHLVSQWLGDKERESARRRSEEIEIARFASAAAERAAVAAERAASEAARTSTAAERQAGATERAAGAAERANTRATIAVIIAALSMIATLISIWVNHNDARRTGSLEEQIQSSV
jgi:hypothetical protein